MRPSASPPDPVATLEKLLAIPVGEPQQALVAAADLVAASFGADKVDVFLYEARRDTLVALGSSMQPLSSLQHKHGLDVLALGNGGRVVEVFTMGRIFVSGALESDPAELRGVKETLHVRSMIGVPLDVAGERRGVLALAALAPERWTEADGQFAAVVARWVGIVLRQSELARELTESSVAAGRRMAAEELVTVFAHDARNVVYPVDLTVHAIGRRAERDGRQDDVDDARRARRGLGRLSALVSDVLDVARLEQGLFTFDLQPTALAPLVEEVAALLASPGAAVTVLAPDPLQVLADPARLRQALENVIANALKHSPRDVAVEVRVERRATKNGVVAAVVVSDRGPGVAAEDATRIFDRFVRGSGGAGLGLGLYLARRIALGHKGNLTFEPQRGGGARFVLSLPCVGA